MKKHLLVIGLYILLISIMTFPLVFGLNTYMPGFFSTDESYSPVWNAWWLKFCFTNHFPINPVNYLAHPFGMDYFLFGYLFFLINLVLALLTNPVFTYNFQVLVNFILAAFFTYLLVHTIAKNRICAFFSGLLFGFCPYIFVRSWQHLGETYLWMMPMILWLLFALKEKPTRSKKILLVVGIFFSGIALGTAYYTVIILATFLSYFIARSFMIRHSLHSPKSCAPGYLKNVILLLGIGYSLTVIQYFTYIKNAILLAHTKASAFNPYHRPFEDLFAQSAKQLSYFLPAAMHPIFGKFTEQFVGSSLYGVSFTEHTLYLGWTPLVLAFIAFRKWRKNRKLPAMRYTLYADENFHIGFFVLLAIVAWFFSQPPWWQWGSLRIYMPSFFMYKILPMFRAYCRFGIVVMLSVAVLAGFGLKFILERFKKIKLRLAVTALFCGLALFEFWNYPPFKVIDVSAIPQAYYWLKDEPGDFAIAEYPLITNCPIETYKFYQTKHQKKIINGSYPGIYAFQVAKTIVNLSSQNTAGVLKWMGVKYVFVHREEYTRSDLEEIIEELNNISGNPGLRLVRSFPAQECPQKDIRCVQKTGPIDVYEVIATPTAPQVEK